MINCIIHANILNSLFYLFKLRRKLLVIWTFFRFLYYIVIWIFSYFRELTLIHAFLTSISAFTLSMLMFLFSSLSSLSLPSLSLFFFLHLSRYIIVTYVKRSLELVRIYRSVHESFSAFTATHLNNFIIIINRI